MDKCKMLWLDLWGNSYHGIASTPTHAKEMARQMRDTARWLETVGCDYLAKINR